MACTYGVTPHVDGMMLLCTVMSAQTQTAHKQQVQELAW